MKPLSLVSIIIIAVAVLATAGFLVWQNQQTVLQIVAPSVSPGVPTSVDAEQNIANANDCIKAGYPSVQTVPGIQECRTPGGKRFKWHFTADDLIIAAYEDLGGKIISIDSKKIVAQDQYGFTTINLSAAQQEVGFFDEHNRAIPFSSLHIGDWVQARGWAYSKATESPAIITPDQIYKTYPPGKQPPEEN